MTLALTPRRAEFLAAIQELARDGKPPDAAALASRLGISRQGVKQQLEALEALGLIEASVPATVTYSLTARARRLPRFT